MNVRLSSSDAAGVRDPGLGGRLKNSFPAAVIRKRASEIPRARDSFRATDSGRTRKRCTAIFFRSVPRRRVCRPPALRRSYGANRNYIGRNQIDFAGNVFEPPSSNRRYKYSVRMSSLYDYLHLDYYDDDKNSIHELSILIGVLPNFNDEL